MSLLALSGTNSVSGGYEIDNSCKFEDDNDEWLYRTNASGTNRKTWTVSWWFKQTEIPSTRSSYVEIWQGGVYGNATRAGIDDNDRIWIDIGGGDGNTGTLFRSLSTARLRDTSAWYHIVIACDSTQSTEADRLKVWLNGVEVTAWDQKQYPTLNFQSALQGTGGVVMKWGSYDATYNGYSGYLAECNYVDGVTATQNDFGEFDSDSGIWKPKEYTGSYGTNGSYLDFEIASDLGANAKGNDVNFSLNNITSADQSTDTPTNNFATLNPLHATSYYTLKEGGTVLEPSQSGWGTGVSSIGVTSGKWYFEERSTATDRTTIYGVVNESDVLDLQGDKHVGDGVYSVGFYGNSAQVFSNGSVIATYNTFNQNQLVACALDLDNGKVYFAIQNTWQNSADPANGTGGISLPTGGSDTYFFGVNGYFSDNDVKTNHGGYTIQTPDSAASDANGYGTFEYAPPSGYYSICSQNLALYG